MARYDYSEQLWRDDAGAPIPCAHPESMGDHCCRAYELTGTRDAWTLATDAEIRPCAECAGPADLPRT